MNCKTEAHLYQPGLRKMAFSHRFPVEAKILPNAVFSLLFSPACFLPFRRAYNNSANNTLTGIGFYRITTAI
jgi:hypothetical protein